MELSDKDSAWAKETIAKTGLFSSCQEPELNELLRGLEKQRYKGGSTIMFQGEIASRLYLVESGRVSIIVRKGKDKTKVAELGPNSYFGEISLLTPRAATATVRAEEDTDIIFLTGETVQALVKKNPVLSELINTRIHERLESQRQTSERK